MNPSRSGRSPSAAELAALVATTLAVSEAAGIGTASASKARPRVITKYGVVRGVDVPGGYAFRGLPGLKNSFLDSIGAIEARNDGGDGEDGRLAAGSALEG